MSSAESSPVRLHIYDVSRGIAARLSPILLGREIPGLWHKNIVIGDLELSYGPPLLRYPADRGPWGTPNRVIELGETAVSGALLDELVGGLARPGGRFAEEAYDILYNNCNTFANEMASILTGGSVPADVLNQSQTWQVSPLLSGLLLLAGTGTAAAATAAAAGARRGGGKEQWQRAATDGAGPSHPAAAKPPSPVGPTAATAAGGGGAASASSAAAAATPADAASEGPTGAGAPAVDGLDELLGDLLRTAAAARDVPARLWEEAVQRFTAAASGGCGSAAAGEGGRNGPPACGVPFWVEAMAEAAEVVAAVAAAAAAGGAPNAAAAAACPAATATGGSAAAATPAAVAINVAARGDGGGGVAAVAAASKRGGSARRVSAGAGTDASTSCCGSWAPAGPRCPFLPPRAFRFTCMRPGRVAGAGDCCSYSGGGCCRGGGCSYGAPPRCCGPFAAAAGEPFRPRPTKPCAEPAGGYDSTGFDFGLGLGLGLGLSMGGPVGFPARRHRRRRRRRQSVPEWPGSDGRRRHRGGGRTGGATVLRVPEPLSVRYLH